MQSIDIANWWKCVQKDWCYDKYPLVSTSYDKYPPLFDLTFSSLCPTVSRTWFLNCALFQRNNWTPTGIHWHQRRNQIYKAFVCKWGENEIQNKLFWEDLVFPNFAFFVIRKFNHSREQVLVLGECASANFTEFAEIKKRKNDREDGCPPELFFFSWFSFFVFWNLSLADVLPNNWCNTKMLDI